MSRPSITPFTRALDFIESGAPDAVREFMAHAREVCLRRGIVVSGFPTGARKARVAKAAPAEPTGFPVPQFDLNHQFTHYKYTDLPPGTSMSYTDGTPEPVYTEHGA